MHPLMTRLGIRILPRDRRGLIEQRRSRAAYSAPLHWEESPTACHSVAWNLGHVAGCPAKAYERNVSIPVRLTPLKSETDWKCRRAFLRPQQKITNRKFSRVMSLRAPAGVRALSQRGARRMREIDCHARFRRDDCSLRRR